jgi:hypothetical protein
MDKPSKSRSKKSKVARLVRLFNSAPALWLLGPSGLVLAKDTDPDGKMQSSRRKTRARS